MRSWRIDRAPKAYSVSPCLVLRLSLPVSRAPPPLVSPRSCLFQPRVFASRFCLESFLSRLAFVSSPMLYRLVFILSCLVLLVSCYLGRSVSWSLGLRPLDPVVSLVLWYVVSRSLDVLAPWSLCTLVSWSLGLSVPWPLGLLDYWSLGVWVSGLSPHFVPWSLRFFDFGLLVSGPLNFLVSVLLAP